MGLENVGLDKLGAVAVFVLALLYLVFKALRDQRKDLRKWKR
jgi:hypothetical protein